jgi:hypothetical protein
VKKFYADNIAEPSNWSKPERSSPIRVRGVPPHAASSSCSGCSLGPLSECRGMRRKIVIIAVAALVLSIATTFSFLLRSAGPPAGNFSPSFSAAERQEIVSAARRDATRQMLAAIKRAEFRLAWTWSVNGRKQTVRGVGQQPGGQIWVHFGMDDPKATDGYAIWARYFMTKTNGHWQIAQLF